MRIDLHCHSDASDGTDPPAEVFGRARDARIDVLALTDHDTVAGHADAVRALPRGLALVSGVELSCRLDDVELHMLGLLFDVAEPALAAELGRLRSDRTRRARAMVERLSGLGVAISWDQVARIAGDGVVGRPHIARAMVAAGAVDRVDQAFTGEWIAAGGRAYVGRHVLEATRAIRLVRDAGGVCVLAHPRAGRRAQAVRDGRIAELAAAGLAGVEVDHPEHTPADRSRLRSLAAELGLAATGGSDDHGRLTGYRLGCESTSPQAYEVLLGRARGRPVTA